MKAIKIISLFLALAMCLSLVSPVFAASEKKDEPRLAENKKASVSVKDITSRGTTADGVGYYIVDNSYVVINDYSGVATELVIPSKINGYPVKEIAGFYGCTSLVSITIPNSVTSIGEGAFYGCTSLTSIKIPDSVTYIDSDVFSGCTALTSIEVSENNANYCDIDGVLFSRDKRTLEEYPEGKKSSSYNIPDNVTTINAWAFSNCLLSSITIPDSVKEIVRGAFYDCIYLTNIQIPNSVKYIGQEVFMGCISLTSIKIPDSVTSMGWYAFNDCISLKSIKISNSLEDIGGCTFSGCTALTSIKIPDSVTCIWENAFAGCISLKSIEIPNSVTRIDEDVFSGCDKLTIYGVRGSQADFYAKQNGIPFLAGEMPGVSTLIPNEESEYTIDTEKGILNGVEAKTSLETLISNLENGESIVVTKPTGEEVTDININIGTGWVINLVDESGEAVDSVTVVVKGDITGDGMVNSRDIAALQRQVLAPETLEGVYLLTADMNMDGEVNSRDIARVQKMVLE